MGEQKIKKCGYSNNTFVQILEKIVVSNDEMLCRVSRKKTPESRGGYVLGA